MIRYILGEKLSDGEQSLLRFLSGTGEGSGLQVGLLKQLNRGEKRTDFGTVLEFGGRHTARIAGAEATGVCLSAVLRSQGLPILVADLALESGLVSCLYMRPVPQTASIEAADEASVTFIKPWDTALESTRIPDWALDSATAFFAPSSAEMFVHFYSLRFGKALDSSFIDSVTMNPVIESPQYRIDLLEAGPYYWSSLAVKMPRYMLILARTKDNDVLLTLDAQSLSAGSFCVYDQGRRVLAFQSESFMEAIEVFLKLVRPEERMQYYLKSAN